MTPMLLQYRRLKDENPECILFFRLGDFYETFYEDAEVTSRELGIVLTGRDAGDGVRAPMAGVPYQSAHNYISKLVSRGYKVAICEQMEDPRFAKGLVKREVVRVITPGTITDERMLDERANNYIACILNDGRSTGLAAADVSTGEFFVMEFADRSESAAFDELRRLGPSECLVDSPDYAEAIRAFVKSVSVLDITLEYDQAKDLLKRHFGVASLHGFGCENLPAAVRAAAALLQYVSKTQRGAVHQLRTLLTRTPGEFLAIDSDTRRNLELFRRISDNSVDGSLLGVLDRTVTAMGARRLKQVLDAPFRDPTVINERLDAVEELARSTLLRHDLRQLLKQVKDIERLVSRITGGSAGARELCSLKMSLSALPDIKQALSSASSVMLSRLCGELPDLSPVHDLIDRAIVDDPPVTLKEGGLIKTGYDSQVDELRQASVRGKEWIAGLEASERERTGIKNLRVGYNKVFGYYIEVSNANQKLVPPDYIRKQTLTNAERYVTPELKEYEEKILHAEERLSMLEYEIFCDVRDRVAAWVDSLQAAARIIAEVDLLAAFAEVAVANGYVRPTVNGGSSIKIVNSRHPVVEVLLGSGNYVSNDVLLDGENNRLLIITGPNMAGKSTYARSVALIVIMAQMGCFVPASRAEIGCADRVFARVGASDDLSLGRSTFMVEMTEVANILNHATCHSLVILDEVGRGTGTYDGMSLAWAIAEDLCKRIRARTILTTHYHQLTELEETLPGAVNYVVAVKESGDKVTFLHKIVRGRTDKSYGVHVARLAGVPAHVVARASEILGDIDAEISFRKARREVAASKGRSSKSAQLSLILPDRVFNLLARLRAVDPDNITPVQALQLLAELVKLSREE